MAYNPYKWFSKGKKRTPLKSSAPLLLKIRNGDFNLSEYLGEAESERRNYQRLYDKEYNSQSGDDINTRKFHAHQKAKLRNVAYLKLLEAGMVDEEKILRKLRDELTVEFGVDLWDKVTSVEMGLKTIEDIYWKYKELSGMGTTPSEMKIQLRKKS